MMTITHAKLFKVYVSATTMTDEAMGKTFGVSSMMIFIEFLCNITLWSVI